MAPGQAPTQSLSLLDPHPKRPDWFVIPDDWFASVVQAPLVDLLPNGKVAVHLSHLALLAHDHDRAWATLTATRHNSDERAAFDAETDKRGWRLRPYQHEAREFILSRRGTLLALAMRLGKTASALCAHELSDGPLLIVAPLATRGVWLDWIERRWPGIEPLVLRGRRQEISSEELGNHPIVFAHYDVVAAWQNLASVFRLGTLILDEAHLISNRKSKRATGARMLAVRADRVIALTGTPMWNRPSGLWSILSCINPGAWGKWFDFSSRYCDGHPGTHGFIAKGSSNEEEFRQRMSEVMLRRTWQDVMDDLPAIQRTVEIADMTEAQGHQIDVLAEKVRTSKSRSSLVGHIARLRRLLGKIKMPVAIDAANRALDSDGTVIVWTWHREVAKEIAGAIYAAGNHATYIVTGDHPETRDATIASWRENGGALVITIATGQVGIDLSAAQHEVFAEADWTPAVIAQAEMRPYSPLRPMFVTYVIADHDVDKRIVNALGEKCALSDAIGVPAAESAIEVITQAFGMPEEADMDRVAQAFLSADTDGEGENDGWVS